MTSSRFIYKWLGTKKSVYTMEAVDEMRDDLYAFAEGYTKSGSETQPKPEVMTREEATAKVKDVWWNGYNFRDRTVKYDAELINKVIDILCQQSKHEADSGTNQIDLTEEMVKAIREQTNKSINKTPNEQACWQKHVKMNKGKITEIPESEKEQSVTDCSQLKPCPFCKDGEAGVSVEVALFNEPDEYAVGCTTCFVKTKSFRTKEEAIAAWNKRACYSKQEVIDILPTEDETDVIYNELYKDGWKPDVSQWMRAEIIKRLTNQE